MYRITNQKKKKKGCHEIFTLLGFVQIKLVRLDVLIRASGGLILLHL